MAGTSEHPKVDLSNVPTGTCGGYLSSVRRRNTTGTLQKGSSALRNQEVR